nr:TetR/AcrR family transcriptional regulator [Mucilaginibacter sp. L294]
MSIIITTNIDSRAKLLTVAEQLFAEQSYAVTSIREIAGRASMNMSLIGYYFGSKKALYEKIFQTRLDEMRLSLQQLKWQPLSAVEKLDVFLKIYTDRYQLSGDFQRLLYREIVFLSQSDMKELISSYLRENVSVLKDILTAGVTEGCFKSVNPSLFFLTILSVMSTVIHDYPLNTIVGDSSDYSDINLKTIKNYLHQILITEPKAAPGQLLKNE